MRRNIQVELILNAVNSVLHTEHTIEEVYQKCRKRELVLTRSIYWYFKKKHVPKISYSTLAGEFGKDHATVLHAVRQVQALLDVHDRTITRIVFLTEQTFVDLIKERDESERLDRLEAEQQMVLKTQRERAKTKARTEIAKRSLENMYKLVSSDQYIPGWIRHKAAQEYQKALLLLEV